MTFDEAFRKLLDARREGTKHSMDPADPGNYTPSGQLKGSKYGISARSYPLEDIGNLTLSRARLIYWHDFWIASSVEELPAPIRFDVFDMAVNSGPEVAIKTLQRAINVEDDGIVGPITQKAASLIPSPHLRARFNAQRLIHFTTLSTWSTHGKGWARRIAANLMEI